MKMRIFKTGLSVICLAGILLAAGSAKAASLTYTYNAIFTSPTVSSSSTWLTATFVDIAGGVELTLSTSGLTGGEFIDGSSSGGSVNGSWYFNVDPSKMSG